MLDPMIIPIEIRPDYFVQIMGIPHDLTPEEARKIASVILAYAPGPYRIELEERIPNKPERIDGTPARM